jgi:hypothetical protein
MSDSGEQPRRSGSGWTVGRVIAMVFASIGGLIGLALVAGAVAVFSAYGSHREEGYFTTDRERLESTRYAITAEDIDLGADEVDWAPDGLLGDVRVRVESDQPVFVGIGRDEDVDAYLGGVARDELIDVGGSDVEFAPHDGRAPSAPPGEQGFWEAQAEGSGEQELVWDAEFGRWTMVVMNLDAAQGVGVEADAGVKLDWAIWAGIGMLVVGLLMSAGAVLVILLVGRRADRAATPTT